MKVLLVGMMPYGNPLACAYLKAFADGDRRLSGRVCCELAEFERFQDPGGIADEILERGCDLVGFSTYIWNCETVAEVCRALKARRPATALLVGGPQLSFRPDKFLESVPADFAAVGEGERTFADLLHALDRGEPLSGVAGLAFRDGALKVNAPRPLIPDIAAIPSPILSGVIDPARYAELFLESSRGCPYDCSFCDWQTNRRVRCFPAERIIAEIKRIAAGRPDAYVFFADADFFLNKPRAKRLLPAMLEAARGSTMRMGFETNLGHWDEELILLVNDRRIHVNFGVQSMNPAALKAANRGGQAFHAGRIARNIRLARRLAPRAQLRPEFMMGMPGDTLDGYRGTLDWMLGRRFSLVYINQFLLLPGSPFSLDPGRHGIVSGERPPFRLLGSATFPERDMEEARRLSYQAKFALSAEWFVGEAVRYLGRVCRRTRWPTLEAAGRFAEFCEAGGELPWLPEYKRRMIGSLKLDDPVTVSRQPFHGQLALDSCRSPIVGDLLGRFAKRLLETEGLAAAWPALERFLEAAKSQASGALLWRSPKFQQVILGLARHGAGQRWLIVNRHLRSRAFFADWGPDLLVCENSEEAAADAFHAAASIGADELDGLPRAVGLVAPPTVFDGAVLNGVFSYLPSRLRVAALRALAARCRPGGRLLLIDDWSGLWPLRLVGPAGATRRTPPRLRPEEAAELLERSGWGKAVSVELAPMGDWRGTAMISTLPVAGRAGRFKGSVYGPSRCFSSAM